MTGRPSKYKPAHCKALIEHMKGGLSFESFAGVIGTHRDTLYEWLKRHPAFSDAKKHGDALSLLWWERIGKAAMLGEPIEIAGGRRLAFENFNTTMWIFAMKNRHGWRDKHEVSQPAPVTINPGTPSSESALKEIREILEAYKCSVSQTPLSLESQAGLLPRQ